MLLRRGRPRDGDPLRAGQGAGRRVPDRVTGLIRQFVITALEQHELPADEDPDALTFELNGMILAANANFVLHEDHAALEMARRVVRRRLGLATSP